MSKRSTRARAARNDISARGAPVLVGCFSSSKPLSNQGTYKYQSSGYCSGICTSRNQGVVGLSNGNTCWCGNELPAANTKVLDARCDTPCQGYGIEDCGGGTYYFTVWLTGLENNVPSYNPNATSSTSSSTVQATSTSVANTTKHKHTSTSASTSTSTPSTKPNHGLSDKSISIIAGVVIGFIAFVVLAIVFCCLWRRRKRTGSFRRKPSTLLSVGSRPSSWASIAPDATISILAGSRKWEGRISATPRRSLQPVAAAAEPRDPSMSEDNPFYTPQERQSASRESSTYSRRTEGSGDGIAFGADIERDDFQQRHMPMSEPNAYSQTSPLPTVLQLGNPSRIDMLSRYRSDQPTNTSPPGEEEADVVSPMAPPKRHTQPYPMVHYPSWSEVSDFDFAGESGSSYKRNTVNGWHPWRERKDGRYELP